MSPPYRQVRAHFDDDTLRVYQAYSPAIARNAVRAQRFVAPFKRERMTWVKPSFTWMMYRAGWGSKPDQEHILAIDITRKGFEWALANAAISHFDPALHASPEAWKASLDERPVRIQWDPERSLALEPLAWRAIQVGIGPRVVGAYVDEWTVRIEDVTELAHRVKAHVDRGEIDAARALLPEERPYPLPDAIVAHIAATGPGAAMQGVSER